MAAALLAGAGTMIVELAVARSMGAYFGTSLYVWTSVIGVTMMALSAGYVLGGRWVDRSADSKLVLRLMLVGGALMLLLPWLSPAVMWVLLPLGLQAGSLLAAALLLGAPLIAFGAVTPAAIRLGAQEIQGSGRHSGAIYALSTFGGVAASLATSLLLVPHLGVRITCTAAGALTLVLTGVLLRKS